MIPGASAGKWTQAVGDRFMSIFRTESYVTESSSVQARARENRVAIEQIKENPILGIGAGSPRVYEQWTYPTGSSLIYAKYWILNSYLELWLIYGLPGILSFAWLSVVFLIRSFVLFRRLRDPTWKAVVVAFFAGYIGFLWRSITQMHIVHDRYHIFIVAIMWGVVEALWRLHNKGEIGVPAVGYPGHEGQS
jgi:O-antigen ligase